MLDISVLQGSVVVQESTVSLFLELGPSVLNGGSHLKKPRQSPAPL